MPSVTVIVYKGQRSDEAEQQAAALAASLTKASGRPWTIGRVVHQDARPTRGDQLALKDVLDQNQAWGDGNVWLYGDSTLGAQEHYLGNPQEGLWDGGHVTGTENITKDQLSKPLEVLALNTTRPEEALHTVGHALESAARHIDPQGIREYSGRPEDDPLQVNSRPSLLPVAASASGHGTIHVPPGATRQYDYSGDGYKAATGRDAPWGGTEDGFYRWWLGEAPRQWWDSYAGKEDAPPAYDTGHTAAPSVTALGQVLPALVPAVASLPAGQPTAGAGDATDDGTTGAFARALAVRGGVLLGAP